MSRHDVVLLGVDGEVVPTVAALVRSAQDGAEGPVVVVLPAADGPGAARPRAGDELERELQALAGHLAAGLAALRRRDGHGAPAMDTRPRLSLTRRQGEVLGLLAEGLGTAAIAERLYLSEATVRNHVAAIFQLLDCHSRLQAVARARELGLI